MLVKNMYDKLAINCGFPLFVDDVTTPETTRFLLEVLNQALLNVVDNVYITNNVLQRKDTITLSPGMDHYAVEGMVKSIQYTANNGALKGRFIPFNQAVDMAGQIMAGPDRLCAPSSYVIDRGDIRLFPIPDKPYELEVTVSTTNLVWANNDSSKGNITDINDSIMASKEFCDLVVLRACSFVMARCNNPLSDYYNGLYDKRLKTFIERDSRSFEEPKLYNPRKGHYSPRRGLLD